MEQPLLVQTALDVLEAAVDTTSQILDRREALHEAVALEPLDLARLYGATAKLGVELDCQKRRRTLLI